jgi:hypothetical protein
MKSKLIKLSFVILVLFVQACGDEHVFLTKVGPASGSGPKIKFIHSASDTVGMNLFLDDVKVSGNTPNTITTVGSTNYGKVNVGVITLGNAFPVTNYTSVENTTGTFSVVFPETYTALATFNKKTMSTVAAPSMDASSFYTVAFLGVYPTYETVVYSHTAAEIPLDGKSYIRFANFVNNSTTFSFRMTPPATVEDPTPAPVTFYPAVSYKQMGAFVALPRTGAYTAITVINNATGATYATLANTSFVDNKVYTIFARGQVAGTGSRAPAVSRVIDR